DNETKTLKWTAKSTHTHSFTYSTSGATITATCSVAECPLNDSKATLTIAAPALTTYGGTGSAEATITDTNSIQGTATVSYYKANNAGTEKTGSALASAPTDAGKYWAEITLGTGNNTATAHVAYTIAKADPTYTAPTELTATYGQTLADVTLPDGWAWADSTQSVGNVVSPAAAFKAKFTPDDTTNYNTVENIDVTVTVNKADPTAPTGLTAKTGQTLANVSLPTGWTWADDTTTSVGEVGDNIFKANFAGNDNLKAATNVDVTVTVSPSVTYTRVAAKAATCTATGNKEYYKGSDSKLYTKSGDTYTETTLDAVTIAKTAHTLTAVAAVDAKCTTDGTKAHYKCSVCEKLFEDADGKTETTADALKVTKLGHNYVNGKCTRCGATDPNYGGSSGGYTPVIPSGGTTTTTTTTTTTNTGSFADKTEENNNYAGAEINMKSDELEKAVLTDEDKKVIAAGGTVTVELELEETEPTAEEKTEIENAVAAAKEATGEEYTVAMYFDANLFKTSNGTKTQLHETNGKIAVSFKLPEQFKNTDSSVTRTYAVARIHDGKTEILVCEYDPETDLLTFYTDKFSTYALMYEDAKADDADVSAVDDDDEQGDEGAVDDEQFDETDDDFDELTD
ncbi:MAG: hypothetical protein J6N15_12635, partial [Ruminiclostridium sp.]|nr:hypothetical protein [Ruminiclostridium sp.]